ncbi:MAG: adenylosuccinate lyase, partial [Leptolyngbya sp. SIO3F4]|nr:adenylosuccinate lyase [Leptolyngbya sp. SIO3F4]
GGDFYALISQDPQVKEKLTADEIKEAFNPDYQLRNLDTVYQRLGI